MGFDDPRLVEDNPITINNAALEAKVGALNTSTTPSLV